MGTKTNFRNRDETILNIAFSIAEKISKKDEPDLNLPALNGW